MAELDLMIAFLVMTLVTIILTILYGKKRDELSTVIHYAAKRIEETNKKYFKYKKKYMDEKFEKEKAQASYAYLKGYVKELYRIHYGEDMKLCDMIIAFPDMTVNKDDLLE